MPNRQKKVLRQIMAENLRVLRLATHISQEELAELCGLHRTYISDIERCNRNVSIDNIERIANALHITASDLLRERKKLDEDS
ncbi:helix-turn-helix domain-containing protein [Lawsonibacter sp. JLR.KK007]|jgi:transcriptional regulator with XRE-family HTH domain|uniref:helix-turn-helix domain-containing protein n=1 Tax=Lawsonibacter sp. JLR.KK007 TaxID=3114293 RepID=UPI002FEF241C